MVVGFCSGWWWSCLWVLVLGFVWVFGDFLFRCLVSWVLGLDLGLNCSAMGGMIWLIGGGGGWCNWDALQWQWVFWVWV